MILGKILNRFKKVLIVEDDVVLREALADKCRERGYTVFEASAAQEVMKLVSEKKPQAIVLDLILPMEDGITLLENVRNSGCAVPVIILSNLLGSEDLRADAKKFDAEFYNKSSTSLDEIVSVLEKKM